MKNYNINGGMEMKNIFTLSLFIFFSIFLFTNANIAKAEGPTISVVDKEYAVIEENIQYRKTMGLEHSQSLVEKLVTNGVENDSINTHGAFLTNEELTKVEAQIQKQRTNIPKIREYLTSPELESNFSGIYVDQSNGGTVHIGYKNKEFNKGVKDKIKKMYSESEKIVFFSAKHSQESLNNINKLIHSQKAKLKNTDINIVSISSNFKDQSVDVGIFPFSEDKEKLIREIYGNNINVFENMEKGEEENRFAFYRPLMGGIAIVVDGSGCTGGFSSTGSSYITAGHCGAVGDGVTQGGSRIGEITTRINTGAVDAAIVRVDNRDWLSNDFYANSARDRNFFSWQGELEEYEGEYVCKVGRSTGYTCGTVQSTYFSIRTHHNMSVASYTSDNGDSGSPVFYTSELIGLHEGSSYLGAVYSHVDNVQRALNINPLVSN